MNEIDLNHYNKWCEEKRNEEERKHKTKIKNHKEEKERKHKTKIKNHKEGKND